MLSPRARLLHRSRRAHRPVAALPSGAVRALVAGLVVACVLVWTPVASARFVLGIGDQSTRMLEVPRFAALGLRDSRLVVPYDVAVRPAQLARYAPVLDAARLRRARMLVSFAASADAPLRLPSVRSYRRAIRAFRVRFPWVHDLGAWNEANHASQPTARHPDRAAQLYNALRAECRACRIVAADVLDQAGFALWVRRFRRLARAPRIWGLHDYVDVNRNRDVSVPRLRRATGGRGVVWLTETGGVVRFARSFGYDERRAARSTRHVLRIAARRRGRGGPPRPPPCGGSRPAGGCGASTCTSGRARRSARAGTPALSPPTAARGRR